MDKCKPVNTPIECRNKLKYDEEKRSNSLQEPCWKLTLIIL